MTEEVMVEGYEIMHGPKKTDRDWLAAFSQCKKWS